MFLLAYPLFPGPFQEAELDALLPDQEPGEGDVEGLIQIYAVIPVERKAISRETVLKYGDRGDETEVG